MMVKRKILIPADDELRRLLEHSFLHRDTFEFLTASSGEEALRLIESEDPLLAILDLDMPGLSGDECCREVKGDPFLSNTPLALIATSANPTTRERCQAAGCDAVLTKPVEKRQLLETICHLLQFELRGEDRVSVDLKGRIRFGEGRARDVQVIDLNHGGLFLHSLWLKPAGTPLNMNLFLPEPYGALRCEIEVVWVNHPEWIKAHRLPVGMGVKFIEPPDDFTAAIDAIYTSLREE